MDRQKKILICAVIVAAVVALIAIFADIMLYKRLAASPSLKINTETQREIIIDTLIYAMPVPRDSTVLRYETVRLPASHPQSHDALTHSDTDTALSESAVPESIDVDIPITQKTYTAPEYTAYVSGYRPVLDSISVYPRTEILTITQTVTEKERPKRWSIGPVAGYGYDPQHNRFAPFIGIGLSYGIIRF